jgi:hypothetical protein
MSNTRYIAAGAATLGAILYLWPSSAPAVPGAPPAGLKTTGMQNVEKAYQRGGATSTHTKAYGGTVQGKAGEGSMREGGATGNSDAYRQEGIGDDQRASPAGKLEKAWGNSMLGSDKGR